MTLEQNKLERVDTELVFLSDLALAVDELVQTAVTGIRERMDELLSDDNRRVLSAIHEILTAADLLARGMIPEFLSEVPDAKSPDILVTGIEVECKRRSALSDLDLRNRNVWGGGSPESKFHMREGGWFMVRRNMDKNAADGCSNESGIVGNPRGHTGKWSDCRLPF